MQRGGLRWREGSGVCPLLPPGGGAQHAKHPRPSGTHSSQGTSWHVTQGSPSPGKGSVHVPTASWAVALCPRPVTLSAFTSLCPFNNDTWVSGWEGCPQAPGG